MVRVKKYKVYLCGGPWAGKEILLSSGTFVFRVGDFCGHYDIRGQWHDLF